MTFTWRAQPLLGLGADGSSRTDLGWCRSEPEPERSWSAGCAHGEEVLTLAVQLEERPLADSDVGEGL